jgi:hypothetical protein
MWGLQVLLVNVYALYHSAHIIIWKTDKKNILDQYKFREEIVKSWMDGDNQAALTEDARKRKRSEVAPQAHSISPCSLCHWAMKEKTSRDKCRVGGVHVGTCDKCNVSLCLSCFKPFHTISDIERLRSDVRKNYYSNKNG